MAETLNRAVDARTVSPLFPPGGLRHGTRAGDLQLRNISQAGWRWTETYNPIRTRDADEYGFYSDLVRFWNRNVLVDLEHPQTPGSGIPPHGLGTSGVQVRGSGQTGTTITTDGWPASTAGVVKKGDVIAFDSIVRVFKVEADASSDGSGIADIKVFPPIFSGNAPPDNDGVTTTGVKFRCVLWRPSGLSASIRQVNKIAGVKVEWREKIS